MLKKLAQNIHYSLGNREYDQEHKRDANKAYAAIVAQQPDRRLSAEQERIISQYAQDVFGEHKYAPWLRVYTAFRGEFLEGWIPDNYFGRHVVPLSVGSYRIGAKTLARKVLQTDTLPDIAYHVNGLWMDTQGTIIAAQEVSEFLFKDTDTVFVKRDTSMQGKGVMLVSRKDFNVEDYSGNDNFVVQSPIETHPEIKAMLGSRPASIRITTLRHPDGQCVFSSSLINIGEPDKSSFLASEGVRLFLKDETGELFGYLGNADWTVSQTMPETGFDPTGQKLPGFENAVALCKELHAKMPHILIIGWDIMINPSGTAELMEWNPGHTGIIRTEAAVGPCFKGLGWENIWKTKRA